MLQNDFLNDRNNLNLLEPYEQFGNFLPIDNNDVSQFQNELASNETFNNKNENDSLSNELVSNETLNNKIQNNSISNESFNNEIENENITNEVVDKTPFINKYKNKKSKQKISKETFDNSCFNMKPRKIYKYILLVLIFIVLLYIFDN